jgi:Reverse transcriptase (RNA-dependent DNA polymerase)
VKHKGVRTIRVKTNWLDGDPTWIPLDVMKAEHPFLIVDYYTRNPKLFYHPDFKWVAELAVKEPQKIRDMRKAFKASVDRLTPKYQFGVEVPRDVRHALELDRQNGNNLWAEAIGIEVKQINDYKTFRRLIRGENLSGHTRIPYHIVFAVKFDGRRKARLVAGGHKTIPTKEDIYSGVVGIEAVRIGFLLARRNKLRVCAADIGNAFLYGKTKEKVYIVAGREFGPELQGETLIIDKGLYGLRSSSARFHEHLSEKLRSMGYHPTKADADFWIKDCGTHYEYMARYVDDLLSFSLDPMAVMDEVKKDYMLKGVGVPEYYLGGNIETLDGSWQADDVDTGLSAKTYALNIVEKFEKTMQCIFQTKKTPMSADYHPESDETASLDATQTSLFRGMIGSANWMITLGRFDIAYATATLARFSMAPRKGHLKAMVYLFGYIKMFPHGRIIVDAGEHIIKQAGEDSEHDWTEFYPDAEEDMPPDAPTPKGRPMKITVYADADHAHDVVTRRSVTGILLFIDNMPITWMSKRQKTVETSTYGSELVAARIAVEMIIEFRYKLRMLGVPIDGPAILCGDNQSVILNTTVPSSQLKKKHNAIAYHRIREAIAAGIVKYVKIDTKDNFADCLTKPLVKDLFHSLVGPILFRKPGSFAMKGVDESQDIEKTEKPPETKAAVEPTPTGTVPE